jgi:hypothetical protein
LAEFWGIRKRFVLKAIITNPYRKQKTTIMKKPHLAIIAIGALFTSLALSSFSSLPTLFLGRKVANNAYQTGEILKYRIHYGPVNAGLVSMSVLPQSTIINGKNTYTLRVEGETLKSFDWAYKVRDKFESWVDQESQAPLRYAKTVRENNYFHQDVAIYDHDNKKLRNKQGELTIPQYTQDIASAIYYLRNLDYTNATIGKQFPVDVYIDNQVYSLPITYKGKEVIKTDLGKIRCIKIKPKLVVDRVFKHADALTVWVTDDANHIPVRIEGEIYVGSIKVDLIQHQGLKNAFSAKVL